MIAVLESEATATRLGNRGCAIMAVAVASLLVLLSLVHVIGWDPVMVIVGSLFGVPAALQLTKGFEESYSADIEAETYVRLYGPIYLRTVEHEESSTDYYLRVGGEDFSIGQQTFNDLREVAWASVEYALCSRTVFMLRDASGRVLMQHATYLPNATSHSVADYTLPANTMSARDRRQHTRRSGSYEVETKRMSHRKARRHHLNQTNF
jgi:hypothetical protein